jgi:peptide-methionine (R)-S-oxide reductase
MKRTLVNLLKMSQKEFPLAKSDAEWRATLSPEQFSILRQKGTERPGTGEYLHNKLAGVYNCAGCNTPIYKSSTKFDSHCGWPSFYEALPGALHYNVDTSHGMERTEMVCSNCGGHLGHVFKNEGYDVPTNERHCANSISLKFEPEKK